MTPKYCTSCNFCKKELVPHPSGHYIPSFLCTNINCSDPVDASPIPCGIARREVTLCGLHGKYYEPLAKPEDLKQGNIIQLRKE